jgi:transcription elongation GreA/GreB family factor
MRRKVELESQLVRARGMDFINPRVDVVSIGTIVNTTNLASNSPEKFTILGAWDSDPDNGIISYLTPIGQALLNHKVGDEVDFDIHGAPQKHRVDAITAWKTA